MDIAKLKELNGKVIEKAIPKLEKALANSEWDTEVMDALTDAITNCKNLSKMEYKDRMNNDQTMMYSEKKKVFEMKKGYEDTDFMSLVSDIMEHHGDVEGAKAIVTVMNELMEDLKILNNRIYNTTMMKLRDIAH